MSRAEPDPIFTKPVRLYSALARQVFWLLLALLLSGPRWVAEWVFDGLASLESGCAWRAEGWKRRIAAHTGRRAKPPHV